MNTLLGLCASGLSGNMMVGALLSYGLPLAYLEEELAKLPVRGYQLICESQERQGVPGVYFNVEVEDEQPCRHLRDIQEIIDRSDLSQNIKRRSKLAFHYLAEAEAKVHETTINQVHFHEVGAVDCIVDIVGTMIGLDYFNVDAIVFSPLHVGSGTIVCAHGELPVPAPATKVLLEEIPYFQTDIEGELVTPTGAALAKTLGIWRPDMDLEDIQSLILQGKLGVGLGSMDLEIPNVLALGNGLAQGDA